jgi:hypothetical protein
MKINLNFLAILAGLALAVILPFFVYLVRSPVLIVTDQAFIGLYGKDRIRREASVSSRAMFRSVKTVVIANDAGDDIVRFAVDDVSKRPFCVIFPLRFARPAGLYREQYPEVPVILLEGRYPENSSPSAFGIGGGSSDGYFIYKTDIDADFYRAAVAAAVLDREKNGKIAVFFEPSIQRQAMEVFLKALNDVGKPLETMFFTSFSQFSEISDLSCVVLAGSGVEYLEKKTGIPVILFTWLDPSLIPEDVVLVVNDSPWAQAVQAVKMAKAGEGGALIRSKFELQKNKKFSRRALRKIQKMV